jgi:1,4-alpha-glucan branching enzyme
LGVNALELMPPADSLYDRVDGSDYTTTNPFAPDERLGADLNGQIRPMTDLAQLIQTCHTHGMRFILDLVAAVGFDNPYRVINYDAFFVNAPSGERTSFGGNIFRYSSPDGPARVYMKACVRHWIAHYRVDGLRIDDVSSVGSWDFIAELTGHARALAQMQGLPASRFLVAGADSRPQLDLVRQGRIDALWNVYFYHTVRNVMLGQPEGPGKSFEESVRKLIDCRLLGFASGVQAINYVTHRYMQGFRRERLWKLCVTAGVANPEARIKLGFACLLTSVGIAMILAGEEFGDDTEETKSGRRIAAVDFAKLTDPTRGRIFDYVSRLVALRTKSNALAVDDTQFIHADFTGERRIMVWQRGRGNDLVVVVANFSDWGSSTDSNEFSAAEPEYIVPNWPATPTGYQWRHATDDRWVDPNWVGREPISPWSAQVYVLVRRGRMK